MECSLDREDDTRISVEQLSKRTRKGSGCNFMNRIAIIAIWTSAISCIVGCQSTDITGRPVSATQSAERTPGDILPRDGFLPGWVRLGPPQAFIKQDLFNSIDGAAELFLEMGFQRLTVQSYQNADSRIDLEIYELDNATAAMGLYFHKRGKESRIDGLSGRHTGNRFQILAQKGRDYIQIDNFKGDDRLMSVMVELARRTLAAIPDEKPIDAPTEWKHEGLVPGSELIVRGPFSLSEVYTLGEGDILSLYGTTFGWYADFQTDRDGRHSLLLVPYENASTATQAYHHLQSHLDPKLAVIQNNDHQFIFRDFNKEYGLVSLEGNQLEIKLHLTAAPIADLRGDSE